MEDRPFPSRKKWDDPTPGVRAAIAADPDVAALVRRSAVPVRYWNGGLVFVGPSRVEKIQFDAPFFEACGFPFHDPLAREVRAYGLLRDAQFPIPRVLGSGRTGLGRWTASRLSLENVRSEGRVDRFSQVAPEALGALLRDFHTAVPGGPGEVLVHGNFHPSNLFLRSGRLGIMDFASVSTGGPERDLARVAPHAGWDAPYFSRLLGAYGLAFGLRELESSLLDALRHENAFGPDREAATVRIDAFWRTVFGRPFPADDAAGPLSGYSRG